MSIDALVFILLGTVFLLAALWNAICALESRRWPEAPGVISTSYKKETHDAEYTKIAPIVRYRYRVDGLELTGTRVMFGGFISTSAGVYARRITERYRPGQEVVVRYDPQKPEESVLEPGVNTPLIFQFVVSCAAIAVGIYFL